MAPILVHHDPTCLFIVEVSVSNVVHGEVLSQKFRAQQVLYHCTFLVTSCKLTPVKINYGILDKELLAAKTVFEE